VLQRRGHWQQAESEARLACEELASVKIGSAAAAWVEVGEIRRRIGDLDGAEDAFAHADALYCAPTAGLALLRLAQGRPSAAETIIDDALSAALHSPVARARLLPAKVEVAVATGQLGEAAAAAQELERLADLYGTDAFAAAAAVARGRVALAAGDQSATTTLRRAVERWQALEVPYETATAQLLLAESLQAAGDTNAADAILASAISTFDRLGAAYDARHVRRLSHLTAVQGAHPVGLTDREIEVLRLVARGCTNKDIANQLQLSGKTVARHLSNIFVKTGSSTRSAATAFAFDHAIVVASNR
jgi:ATP/maltotriose-dependent transcriptional regulator MalT